MKKGIILAFAMFLTAYCPVFASIIDLGIDVENEHQSKNGARSVTPSLQVEAFNDVLSIDVNRYLGNVCGALSSSGDGHLFIIDYLRNENRSSRCVYGWVETDSAGNPFYNLTPPYDESMFEYTIVRNLDQHLSYMGMNWGWDDDKDTKEYTLAAIPVEGYDYGFYIYY